LFYGLEIAACVMFSCTTYIMISVSSSSCYTILLTHEQKQYHNAKHLCCIVLVCKNCVVVDGVHLSVFSMLYHKGMKSTKKEVHFCYTEHMKQNCVTAFSCICCNKTARHEPFCGWSICCVVDFCF